MKLITQQLANKLHNDNKLKKQIIVDPTKFDQMKQLLTSKTIKELHITDITYDKNQKQGNIIGINNHINRTGTNILIGKQKHLDIDFIDLTNIYVQTKTGIITNCCGKTLNERYKYPSHFICHISTLAHTIKIKKIHGYLFNNIV